MAIHLATAFVTPKVSPPSVLRGAQEVQRSSNTVAPPEAGGASPIAGLAASGAVLAVAAALTRGRPAARRPQVARRFFDFGGSAPAKSFDPAKELGVQDPLGFWDPLGFCEDGDEAAFKRRRTVEIKHGRVSMYACIGYIVPEYFKFPGYLSPSEGLAFQDVPNGLAALSKLPLLGGAQIIAFAGIIETTGFFSGQSTDGRGPRALGQMKDSTEAAEPGNYGVGFPNFVGTVSDPEERRSKLAAELANGRLAMVAIIGMFFQDGLTGSAWGDWALYTASPLRAFESELGVQAPVGFWDPLGLSDDGDAEVFRRRRITEIKHGRISMIACIGYITPEYFKWPGFLSPSAGLRFEDVPNGLAALSKVPSVGWLQIFLFGGLVDVGYFRADDSRAPGDIKNAGILGVPNGTGPMADGESRKTKLNAELANGRLAMMAIIGMFFQDGLTGSAWGDWATYVDSPLRALSKRESSRIAMQAEPLSVAAAAAAAKAGAAAAGAKAAAGAGIGAAAVSKPVPGEEAPPPFGEGEFDKTKQVGALPPLNYWDPAGLTIDEASFRKFRTAEIKHARVAMMASIGLVVQHSNRFVWVDSSVPSGVRSLQDPAAAQGFAVLFLLMGFYELTLWQEDESKAPGDFGDPAGWAVSFPGLRYDTDLRNKELNNGRFAMFAVIGILVSEANTGLDAVEQVDAAIARWQTMGGFENF